MSGHFLVPAWNENGPFEREPRFALTALDVREFEDAVRDARWEIELVRLDAMMRAQEAAQP